MKPYDASHFENVRCKPFLHVGGKNGVLLIHGFTGSVSHMRPLGDALADLGYTVMGFNLPGHATTEADMVKSNWRQWLAASRDALVRLRKQCDTVTVAGLSMGGLLSLLLAEEGLADACVTISAPMPTSNRLAWLAPILAPFKPSMGKGPSPERRFQVDPAFDYGYVGFPTRKMADLQKLIHLARKGLGAIRCPLMTVQSTGDVTVSPHSANVILAGAGTERKQALVLQGVHHVCTLSPALPEIVTAMDAFIQKELP